MAGPTSMRRVRLLDGRTPTHSFFEAVAWRDYPAIALAGLESRWANAREQAAVDGVVAGLNPLEHSHWDWRNKIESVEIGHHMLVAIECEDEVQGIMAITRLPRPAQLGQGSVIYVDYLESAPWNLKQSATIPQFIGVGTTLIAEAIRISVEMGLGGRVGLHSLPQAEGFYSQRCRMTRIGLDPTYHDLPYYEYTDQQAINWLAAIGESL
jgi:hypothetical protein